MTQARGTRRRDPATLRPTLDDCFSIDIRQWRREGRLSSGTHFEVEWGRSIGRAPSAILGVFVREQGVVLLFQRLTEGYDKLPLAEEAVEVVSTPSPVHPITWFICPGCRQKCYKLYAHTDVRFRCQRCLGLRPACDYLSAPDRAARKLAKINRKLGVPHWVPASQLRRPYGVHATTFEKLRAEKAALEAAGVRENGWLLDRVAADRKQRAKAEEKRDPRVKDGVLYLD